MENADRHEAPFTESTAPCLRPITDAGQINSGCDQEKILNRGNEPKDLLNSKDLTESVASKRTLFKAEKVANEAKKGAIEAEKVSIKAKSRRLFGKRESALPTLTLGIQE